MRMLGMAIVYLFVFFALSHLAFLQSAKEVTHHPDCPPFNCGKLRKIGFPFTNITRPAHCGLSIVEDCDKEVQRIRLDRRSARLYEVENISRADTAVSYEQGVFNDVFINDKVLREYLDSRNCEFLTALEFPISSFLFIYFTGSNRRLFKCNRTLDNTSQFDVSYTECKNFSLYRIRDDNGLATSPADCGNINVPTNQGTVPHVNDLFKLLTANFSLKVGVTHECYNCYLEGGHCEINERKIFHCAKGSSRKLVKIAAIIVIFVTGSGAFLVFATCKRRKFCSFWKKDSHQLQIVEAFLRNCGPLTTKRYSYSDIKKMTNSFSTKVGQGGYGGVYKGKLENGCFVAVKVLNESKGDGEEFINEVASISRTSHVNIVALLGFCFEGQKRALVYEFVPNGSLEKFIYEQNPQKTDRQLTWETLCRISVGIARGLEYLHRGCIARILHFDIKPHNILLDESFCPKISDFGLAKVCPRKGSVISMTGARGTAGYIAPEVFCRSFGGVSHKSDVYSYGMMVLEMVGGTKNVNAGVDHTSEIFFPHWIYKRLELDEELGVQGIVNEQDKEIARKMIIVGLWCIQTDPSIRPSMSRVVEMLEGSVDSLQIPPKPYFSSPPRTEANSSITLALQLHCSIEY